MFVTVDSKGHRPSMRAMAQALGVTVASIKYWKDTDRWIQRNDQAISAVQTQVTAQFQNMKALLREGAMEAIKELGLILKNQKNAPDDRIKASIALFKIAKDANAIDLDLIPDLPSKGATDLTQFNDTLPELTDTHSEEIITWDGKTPSPDSSPTSLDSGEPSPTLLEPSLQP